MTNLLNKIVDFFQKHNEVVKTYNLSQTALFRLVHQKLKIARC